MKTLILLLIVFIWSCSSKKDETPSPKSLPKIMVTLVNSTGSTVNITINTTITATIPINGEYGYINSNTTSPYAVVKYNGKTDYAYYGETLQTKHYLY